MFDFIIKGDRKYPHCEYLSRLARPKNLDGGPPSLLGEQRTVFIKQLGVRCEVETPQPVSSSFSGGCRRVGELYWKPPRHMVRAGTTSNALEDAARLVPGLQAAPRTSKGQGFGVRQSSQSGRTVAAGEADASHRETGATTACQGP